MMSERIPGWVWVVLVGGHGLALVWALHTGSWCFPDSDRYLQAAENLRLHGELYARAWPASRPLGQAMQEFTIRPLGYPWIVRLLATGVSQPVLLLVVQNILSLLNLGVVLRWWAQRNCPATGMWGLVLLGIGLFPGQLIYANAVMSEIMLQTVVLSIVVAVLFFIETRKLRYFAGAAVGLVAALLLKPVFYPLALAFIAIGVGVAWRFKRGSLLMISLVPVVVVAFYMRWNEQRTGYFHFSSIAEINLLHYNAAGVVRQLEGPGAEERWVASVLRDANATPDFATRQHLIQARAQAVLWAHPLVYARQHVQGMATFFLDPGRFDISEFLRLEPPPGGGLLAQVRAGGLWRAVGRLPLRLLGMLAIVLISNILRLVAAARGFLRLGRSEPVLRYGRWVAVGLLFYLALLTGPLGAARFLVPVWPLLLALALEGLPTRKLATEAEAGAASA